MPSKRVRFFRQESLGDALLLVSLLVFCFCGARAGEAKLIQFDIPAEPLKLALDAFSGQTGILGVYNGQLIDGRMSAPLKGEFSPRDALSVLLAGTGLIAEYTANEAFVVVVPEKKSGLDDAVKRDRRSSLAPSQDADSPVHVIGEGQLDRAAIDRLTSEERRRLVQ